MRCTPLLFTILIGFISPISLVFGADIPKIPFLKNYTKRDYNARTQNWAAVQDDNNIMYFANNEGVLQFDGVNWDKIEMPNKSIVRSLYCISGDTILAGAYSEFGMIYHDKKGELVYESWNYKIPKEYNSYGEIWRIHKIGERIIIQSFTHLFIFEKGQLIKVIEPENSFMFSFLNNGTLYIQQPKIGLFKLANTEIILVDSSEVFRSMEIWAFLPFDEKRILVGTQFNGFYLYDGEKNIVWENEANDFIKRNNLFSAVHMNNGNYAFGSIQNGLIIVNKSGKILSLENTEVGLQNNTVLSLYEDNAQNIWLGLDNGIDYIKANSPLSYVRKKGGFGTGYTSMLFDNKLYAGTNQGLFFMPLDYSNAKFGSVTDFEIIESTRGQVWCLKSYDGKLYCGHNNGLFLVIDNETKKIGNIAGVWDIAEIPSDSSHLLIGTYQGFYILNKHNFHLVRLNGFEESARRILFYNDNCLVLNHGYKGIFDIRINVENNSAEVLHFYDGSEYLPNKVGNDVFRFNDNIVVTTDSGVFDYRNNQFIYSQFWSDLFEGNANRISNIIEAGSSRYWCFKEGQASLLTFLNEKMYELNTRDFLSIYNTFPTSFENVLKVNDASFLIGNEDGFVLYETNQTSTNKEKIIVDVSSIQFKNKGENSYNRLEFKKNKGEVQLSKLNYSQHRLKIILAIPFYVNQNLVQYRYRINNGPWFEWISGNELKLDDLREGDYLIELQCSIDKKVISGELSVKFTIEPPIFRRWYSYVFYLLLFFTGALLSSKLIKKRIENEKRREALKQQKQMIEKQIKFERDAELAQNELISLRNERLKTDVRHKSKELANTTMSLINKNKILQQFKDVLVDLKKEDIKYRENNKINNLIKKINKEIEHQDNWAVFEKNFDKVHENFLQRLKGKHTYLTPKDLRLAAYLRMNLSSKEIAPLLNISIRSVEISRYRLRKKMDLEHDENLTEYLIST